MYLRLHISTQLSFLGYSRLISTRAPEISEQHCPPLIIPVPGLYSHCFRVAHNLYRYKPLNKRGAFLTPPDCVRFRLAHNHQPPFPGRSRRLISQHGSDERNYRPKPRAQHLLLPLVLHFQSQIIFPTTTTNNLDPPTPHFDPPYETII